MLEDDGDEDVPSGGQVAGFHLRRVVDPVLVKTPCVGHIQEMKEKRRRPVCNYWCSQRQIIVGQPVEDGGVADVVEWTCGCEVVLLRRREQRQAGNCAVHVGSRQKCCRGRRRGRRRRRRRRWWAETRCDQETFDGQKR